MEKQQIVAELAYQAYRNIGFVNKLKTCSLKYDFHLDDLMKKMEKKENLKILKELGYTFKIFTPGQHYNYEESIGNIKLVLSSKISGGIINNHIYIYIDSIKIDVNFLKSNLAFVYRHLINDNEAYITAPTFRNLDDFRNVMSDIISIFEDFKKEFLKQMEITNLTEI